MIAGFEKKLEEMQTEREKAWKQVAKIKGKVKSLKSNSTQLDEFLKELGIASNNKKNAFAIKLEQEEKHLKANYPINGTEIIDTALEKWRQNQPTDKKTLDAIVNIMNNPHKAAVHYDAAITMVVLLRSVIGRARSYEAMAVYRKKLEDAFAVLIKTENPEIYYAQWGKMIYKYFLISRIKDGDEAACIEECKNAYDKFKMAGSNIQEISYYMGYKLEEVNEEVKLLLWRNHISRNDAMDILKSLSTNIGSRRLLMKDYRYEIVKKALKILGDDGIFFSGELKDNLRTCAGMFQGDLEVLFEEYDKKYTSVRRAVQGKMVSDLVTTRKYLSAIPEEYRLVDRLRYELLLKEKLIDASKDIAINIDPDIKWLERETQNFVASNKLNFEVWLEASVKACSVKNYKEKINNRLNELKTVPEYAQSQYSNLNPFKQAFMQYSTSDEIVKKIQENAWQKRWDGNVPDSEVEKYYHEAANNFKAKIKRDTVELAEIKKREEVKIKARKRAMATQSIGDGIKRIVKIAVVASIVMVICAVGWKSIGGELFKDKQTGDKAENAQPNEALVNETTNDIIKETAELSPTATSAEEFTYEVKNTLGAPCIYITTYIGSAETVEVPAVIDGKNVCGIGEWAFASSTIKKVILPDTILTIDTNAFTNCESLEEVVCSANITSIGASAFNGCVSLTSFVCKSGESSLVSLGSSAFSYCSSLKTVEIQSNHSEFTFEDSVFSGCEALESVNLDGENLESVVLKESVFYGCKNLTSISFADKITEMESYAFYECSSLTDIELPKVNLIPESAFSYCGALTKFHVFNTVKGIGASAFSNCQSLEIVTFDAVELDAEEGYIIGAGAFSDTGMTEIEIPSQYQSIGDGAYSNCSNLTKFVWRNSGKTEATQTLGENVFSNSYSISEVYLPSTIVSIGEWYKEDIPMTIYAAEGSVPHQFAVEKGFAWAEWTE